jgi:aerobic carbon-monoxide dehydrogenase medium subunit
MKPSAFEYHAPKSVEEALQLLEGYGGEARLLAGGQSLVPMMNFRLATPGALIDLNRIPELAGMTEEDGIIRIGAMTRQRALEFSPLVAEKLPLLRDALRLIGHLPTRSRGTIGGSIAHADPSAELPMVLRALDGEVRARSLRGERTILAKDLFDGALTTVLEPDEILVDIRLPVMLPGWGWAVEEFSRRHGDFAITAIAAIVMLGEKAEARIACAGVASRPLRLHASENVVRTTGVGEDSIREAAAQAAYGIEPLVDQIASGEFRLHLAAVLTERALLQAVSRASN